MFNRPHWFCPRDHVWFYAFWSALLGWLSWMTTSMLWEVLMEAVVSTPQRWYSCSFDFHLFGLGVVLLILIRVKRFWICQLEEPMNGEALQAWAQDAAVLASVFFRLFSGFWKRGKIWRVCILCRDLFMLWEGMTETADNVSPVLRCFHIFMHVYFVKVSKLHLKIQTVVVWRRRKY